MWLWEAWGSGAWSKRGGGGPQSDPQGPASGPPLTNIRQAQGFLAQSRVERWGCCQVRGHHRALQLLGTSPGGPPHLSSLGRALTDPQQARLHPTSFNPAPPTLWASGVGSSGTGAEVYPAEPPISPPALSRTSGGLRGTLHKGPRNLPASPSSLGCFFALHPYPLPFQAGEGTAPHFS